jgi:hypothetical protein
MAKLNVTEQKLEIALNALNKLEKGFRFSVHGNPYVYHVALKAINEIEALDINKMFMENDVKKFVVYINSGGIMEQPEYIPVQVKRLEAINSDDAVSKWADMVGHNKENIKKNGDTYWDYFEIVVLETK